MSKTVAEAPSAQLSEAMLARFARELPKFPPERKQSAVIACLSIAQEELGWISPEVEKAVAEFLDMPPMAVHEVTTFYDMFNQQPAGRYKLSVCTNLPCLLRGGGATLQRLEQMLGIEDGQTTADGLFALGHCECLGACADAPVLLVNDRDMCSFMDEQRLQQLVEGLKSVEAPQ
jgi:NADH-quinone oxidoreductase subunit E